MRILILFPACLAVLVTGACAGHSPHVPVGPAEAARHRAALATLIVDNRRPLTLRIGYRPAVGPGAEVVVGQVAGRTIAQVAPVPAGEPIILIARDPDGATYEIPPRSLPLDGQWTWTITVDAPFRQQSSGASP